MSIQVDCPSCGRNYSLKDEYAGKKFRCKDCSSIVRIPEVDAGFDDFFGSGEQTDYEAGDEFGYAAVTQPVRRPRKRKPVTRTTRRRKSSQSNTNLAVILSVAGVVGLLVLVGVGIGVAKLVSGSSGDTYAKHEAEAEKVLELFEELESALKTVKDRRSAKTAAVEINRICDELDKLVDRVEKLPKPSRRDDDRLKKKFEPRLKALGERMRPISFRAGANSGREPSFVRAISRLEGIGRRMKSVGRRGW